MDLNPEISRVVEQFPYPGLFLLLILGSIGLPIPEDAVLLLYGFLISRNSIAPFPGFIAVYSGLLVSDFIIYSIGRKYGRMIITHKRFRHILSPERLSALEQKFIRFGALFLLFGRHLWGLRANLFLTAGAMGMSRKTFLMADGAAALLTMALVVAAGYAGGQGLEYFRGIASSPHGPDAAEASDVSPLVLDFSGQREKNGIPGPWRLRQREGRAEAEVISENGETVLSLKCVRSSFAVERAFSADPGEHRYMIWSWKATRLPLSGDVRKKGHNDQALQLLVAFENRKIISYVWDSNAPEGTIADESMAWPFDLKIKVVVVQSGSSDIGRWMTHRRNIYEDYRNIFHEAPPRITGLRFQTNTQHTGDVAEGFVRNIVFSRKSSPEARKSI